MSLLTVTDLGKNFSGLRALQHVTFDVREGEILGLIGPNGAGKTTLFNCIAGRIAPTTGTVRFRDQDITGASAHTIAKLGIARTFQLMKPFASMTVKDNVTVAGLAKGLSMPDARERAVEVIQRVGLGRFTNDQSGALPTAARKRLELAKGLALDPRLLLLDEVLAGLSPGERAPVLDMLLGIRDEGVTLLFVEHVMAAVMKLSDRVLVLHHGELLAEGTPDEIVNDAAVVEAYLGEEMFVADS